MPLQHQRDVGKRQAADLHRDRGRRHQQVHDAVAERARCCCDDEHRLSHQLGQRTTANGLLLCQRGGKVDKAHHGHRQERDCCQCQVGASERDGEQPACERRQVGSGNGADQPARHHQRYRFFTPRRRGKFGCSEAVEAGVGVVVPRDHGGQRQQPEIAQHRSGGTQQRRTECHGQSELERTAPAPAPLASRDQPGGQCATDHIAHHRQGRHPGVRCQAQAHQAIDGNERDVVGQEQSLANGEQPEIAIHGR